MIALAAITLASKQGNQEIAIKKIHKYAGYSFTNQDLVQAQLKSKNQHSLTLVSLEIPVLLSGLFSR
jgi:hypothetical protein